MMIYIFCGGYKALLFSLYLKNVLGKKITVITNDKDVIKYCDFQKINYIKYDYRPLVTAYPIPPILKLRRFRKKLDETVKKIEMKKGDIFLLTGKLSTYGAFYLIKEVSKKGDVRLKNFCRELPIYEPGKFRPVFFRGLISKLLLKIILDLDITFYEANKDPRIGVGEDFLGRYGVKDFAPELSIEDSILEGVKKTKSNFQGFDNIIIDQGPIENQVSLTSVRKLYKDLFELPLDFAFKRHPKPTSEYRPIEKSYYELFKHCEELPNYVPVELFLNNIKNNAISLCSAALITASQMDHIKAISLIDLIEWHHPKYKEEFKQYLIEESKNKILFPASFEELKEILLRK